jgi:hypothetical protein
MPQGSATRSSEPRLWANSRSCSGLVWILPAERTTPSSAIATSQKSRCTSNPIALPSVLTSPSSPSLKSRETQGQTTTTDTKRTGQVAGAATETSPGSKPIVQNGLPNHVLPEGPYPGRATVRPAPDRPPKSEFHAPN